jgi:peroxiredoxin
LHRPAPDFFSTTSSIPEIRRHLAVDASLQEVSATRVFSRAIARKIIALIGLVGFLSLPVFLLIIVQRTTTPSVLRPGEHVPALTLRDLDSGEVHLRDLSERKFALLFFKADCPHCQKETERFERLQSAFTDRLVFLAVSLSDAKRTRDYIVSKSFAVRTLLDEEGKAGQQFGVEEVPTLFLVDSDQTVKFRGVGEQSLEARAKLLERFTRGGIQ